MPQVSVVIPTKNRPELLRQALTSVVGQTFKDLEVIVVDDGTGAEETCRSFPTLALRIVQNAPKQGGASARNTGVGEAQGEFIAFLDDDDRWVPEKLEKQLALFRATPDAAFSFTSVRNVYDDREEVTHVPSGCMNFLERALTRFSGFLTSTLMARKKALLAVGGFDESLPSHQEPDLVIRLSRNFDGVGIDEPLTVMSMSRSYEHISSNLERRIAGRTALLAKHAPLFSARPKVLAKHYFRIALWYRDSGKRRDAHAYFGKALATSFTFRAFAHWLMSFLPSTREGTSS
ncbi:MAG: glycosyltransferase family A protein [Patescibacteria group bacterium]